MLEPLYLLSCLFGGAEHLGLFLYALELLVNYIFANYLEHWKEIGTYTKYTKVTKSLQHHMCDVSLVSM